MELGKVARVAEDIPSLLATLAPSAGKRHIKAQHIKLCPVTLVTDLPNRTKIFPKLIANSLGKVTCVR